MERGGLRWGVYLPKPLDHRIRNREYDARRRQEQPWRAWYNTRRWRALRAAQLDVERLCRMCKARGKIVLATVCDHVEPHRGDEQKFWAGPFQSLCKRCHDGDKRSAEMGFRVKQTIGLDGWPV